MTDRFAGFVVVLADDIREDDAEAVVTALRMVKGVVSVTPVVCDPTLAIAQQRVKREFQTKASEFIKSLA